jgi:hypothetical protein
MVQSHRARLGRWPSFWGSQRGYCLAPQSCWEEPSLRHGEGMTRHPKLGAVERRPQLDMILVFPVVALSPAAQHLRDDFGPFSVSLRFLLAGVTLSLGCAFSDSRLKQLVPLFLFFVERIYACIQGVILFA